MEEDRANLKQRLNKRKVSRRRFIKGVGKNVVKMGVIGIGVYGARKYNERIRGKISALESKVNNGAKGLTHPVDGEYDMDTRMITDWMQIPKIVDSTYRIEVEAVYHDMDIIIKGLPMKKILNFQGTGILLPYGKIITAGHVLKVDKSLRPTPFNPVKGSLTDVTYKLVIGDERYKFDMIDDEVDGRDIGIGIATKIPETTCWDKEIGNYKELKRGNLLYIVGHGLSVGERLRQGNFAGPVEGPYAHEGKLHLSEGVNPGDSGGPIFAVRDGDFEYLGVLTSGIMYGGYHLADDLSMFEGIKESTLKR